MIESVIILLLVATGAAILRPLGLKGWPLIPLGFMTGISIYVVLGYAQAFSGIATSWLFPLGLMFAGSVAFYIYRWKNGVDVYINPLHATTAALLIVVAVLMFGELNLVKYHFDSIRYLISGSLIFTGNVDSLSMNLLTKRFSSVPILHSLGHFSGDFYLRALTSLLSLSALATLYWIVRETFRDRLPFWIINALSATAILLLVSNHGYVWHSFYLNGHLLFGTFLLLFLGGGWLLVDNKPRPRSGLLVLMCAGLAGLVLTRPEGLLLAAFAILPFIFTQRLSISYRAVLLLILVPQP